MIHNTDFPNFISTDQKVLLSDWTVLAKLIFKHASLLKDGGYTEEDFDNSPTKVLSDRQFDDALRGPYSAFFRGKIRAFAIICRLRMAAHTHKQDSIKDNLQSLRPKLQLQSDVSERFGNDELKPYQETLDGLVSHHNQQWEGQLFFWQSSIISGLNEAKLGINDHESDEFNIAEPLSEIFERYQNYNIDLPKVTFPLSFHDYLLLKAKLLILSALSRQHQPHEEKQIQAFITAIKKPLAEIKQAEEALIKTQDKETKEALKDLQFAAFP